MKGGRRLPMKAFITGVSGLLGMTLADTLVEQGVDVSGTYHRNRIRIEGASLSELDLTDTEGLRREIARIGPDVILHTAALTDLRECELHPTLARQINLESTSFLCREAMGAGARFVFFSTDSVFNGKRGNYNETESPCPLNVYSSTKAMAESEVAGIDSRSLIIRSNFFGWGSGGKTNFGEWVVDSLRAGKDFTCFNDAMNSSILVNKLAEITIGLVRDRSEGIYHVGSSDFASRCKLAFCIAETFGLDASRISRGKMSDHEFLESRPLDITLDSRKASAKLNITMPSTQQCIARFKELEEMGYRDKVARMRGK